MESILARALEYTLKYWLKSFTRDQFKLQGRTVQLSNLDMDGDALHSSLGLPPALHVTTARVGKLVITLPSVSNVQVEPIVMQIDRLDLVLEENCDPDTTSSPNSSQSTSSSPKGSGYGFADKIADGMTVEVGIVNLLLETRGGAKRGGATWTPPMASITIRGLALYTTNQKWQVVSLKEARDFSSNKKFIYVFRKLEWESLSIDLLPHPDMFMDAPGSNKRDEDGAKRVFFGGERFLEGISGEAYITLQRTDLNDPLGMEVQLHINEAVVPALSEPGLRALLRFLTGIYVCLNRGDVDPKAQQRTTEAAGCSSVSIAVDHIFFCIKDIEFRLELLMQSLFFSRASISSGGNSQNLTEITIGGLFLRDTFSHPPCTLIQPAIQSFTEDQLHIPDFAKSFCPPIYPLDDQRFESRKGVPFISLHSLQITPTPSPPLFASQTAISCQPLMIHLQEKSCLRISSFIADGIAVGHGAVLPDFSINSLKLAVKQIDVVVPLDADILVDLSSSHNTDLDKSFGGARLHIQNLFMFESPRQKMSLLDLERDPACFCLWEGQPVDAGQKKLTCGASSLSLSLETSNDFNGLQNAIDHTSNLWKCVELNDACIEVAMATPDGRPLIYVPPPGGIVRVGVACKQYISNTSVEQLFFILDLYGYFESVSEKIDLVRKSNTPTMKQSDSWSRDLMSKAPSDTAMSLSVEDLQLRFLEDSLTTIQGKPLVQFNGENLFIKVAHRTLGGAVAISSDIKWEAVQVDCVDADVTSGTDNSPVLLASFKDGPLTANGNPELRAVLWVQNQRRKKNSVRNALDLPFLNVNMVHVVPFDGKDASCHSLNVSACIAGVRLGGGMSYAETLLHRFGILGPDGGPGEGLSRGLKHLSSGPFSKLFKPSPLISDTIKENGASDNGHDDFLSQLGMPEDVDISIDLKNWLFALEGAQEMTEMLFDNHRSISREERCWHSTFRKIGIRAKNNHKTLLNGIAKSNGVRKYPVDFITVGVEGLQTLKPQVQMANLLAGNLVNGSDEKVVETSGGINIEAHMVVSEDDFDFPTGKWEVEKLKFSVEQPIEAVITKDELQHLASLSQTEVDSMGRIAAGVIRVLKLERTIGQEAINQLSNLGSGSLDSIFNSPRLRNGGSSGVSSARSSFQSQPSLAAVVASLDEEVRDSQAKCADLLADVGISSEPSDRHIDQIKQLEQRLENMQNLLKQLRS